MLETIHQPLIYLEQVYKFTKNKQEEGACGNKYVMAHTLVQIVDPSLAAVVQGNNSRLLLCSLCQNCLLVLGADEVYIPPPFRKVTYGRGVLRESEEGGGACLSFTLHQVGWQLWFVFPGHPDKATFFCRSSTLSEYEAKKLSQMSDALEALCHLHDNMLVLVDLCSNASLSQVNVVLPHVGCGNISCYPNFDPTFAGFFGIHC